MARPAHSEASLRCHTAGCDGGVRQGSAYGDSHAARLFFYETLTNHRLDLDDAPTVTAVDALDPERYFTGTPLLSKRHRVRDNLLGSGGYCPLIRRTETLEAFLGRGLAEKAAETVGRTSGQLIARAASFLLLADSRASFEIEGERPPRNRLERWARAVIEAGRNELTLDELNRPHGVLIEDPRFVRAGCALTGSLSASATTITIRYRNSSVRGPRI